VTTEQPPTGLYSPDGKHWWDGSTWQPVEGQAAPTPQQAAPTPQWGAPATQGTALAPRPGAPAPQWGTPPRKKGSSPVLLVGLVAVVALVVGGGAGFSFGNLSSSQISADGPSTPPPIPAEFPGNSQRYLQDVTVSQITQDWQATGPEWTCEPAGESAGLGGPSETAAQSTRCRAATVHTLTIEHDDDAQIRELNLSCQARAESEECRSIFTWLAEYPFPGQPDLRQQAGAWATENVASDLSTTIGRIHLEVRLEPHTIFATPAP
jgi:hypothetical protein